jgi:hypothetical protein
MLAEKQHDLPSSGLKEKQNAYTSAASSCDVVVTLITEHELVAVV